MNTSNNDFKTITPVDLPQPLQRWLADVIQTQDRFEKISIHGPPTGDTFSFWFSPRDFIGLYETIREFPKGFRLYTVDVFPGSIHFQCTRRRR